MTTNFDLAKPVSDAVELLSINLKNATVDTTFDPLHIPDQMILGQRHRSRVDVVEDNDKKIIVCVDFEFRVFPDDDDNEQYDFNSDRHLMKLMASFIIIYNIKNGTDSNFSDQQLQCFADLNGPFNIWPYWRELVQTVTGRVGIAGITMPLFRAKKYDLKLKSTKKKKQRSKNKQRNT